MYIDSLALISSFQMEKLRQGKTSELVQSLKTVSGLGCESRAVWIKGESVREDFSQTADENPHTQFSRQHPKLPELNSSQVASGWGLEGREKAEG